VTPFIVIRTLVALKAREAPSRTADAERVLKEPGKWETVSRPTDSSPETTIREETLQ